MRAGNGGAQRGVVAGTDSGTDERTKRRQAREHANAGSEVDISDDDTEDAPSFKLGHPPPNALPLISFIIMRFVETFITYA